MQGELTHVLAAEGHQPGVVGTGADLGEDDLVARAEQLDPEDPVPAEPLDHGRRHLDGTFEQRCRDRRRLPGLPVVAVDLDVSDRRAALDPVDRGHGEQRELDVEVDEPLDDAAGRARAAALLRVLPCGVDFVEGPDHALALSARRHDRLDHRREPQLPDRGAQLVGGGHEPVGRRRQAQLLGGESTDALAVHGEVGRAGGRHHVQALGLELHEHVGGDRLDLGHHQVRLLLCDHGAECRTVEHRQDVAAVCDLHGGRVGVAVARDDLAPQPLELDGHLLAQFARAEQEDTGGGRAEWGTDRHGPGS